MRSQDRAGCATIPGVIAGVSAQTPSNRRQIDDIDLRLLAELQEDARLSNAELGRRVGLSAPAVAERVARLQESGAITGFHAAVDPRALGFTLSAILRIRPAPRRAPEGRPARPRHARGGRVPPDHRRRLLLPEAARPRRGAPRAGDRRVRVLRADDDVDHADLARPAAGGQPGDVAELELVPAAGPATPRSSSSPAGRSTPDGPGPFSTTRVSVRPPLSATQPQRPGRRRPARHPEDLVGPVGPRRGGQRIAEQDRRELPARPIDVRDPRLRVARSPCAPTPAAPRGRRARGRRRLRQRAQLRSRA